MNISEILGINLKYYRKMLNLSQEKFTEIIGTTLSYINKIENNRADVKLSTIDKFVNKINAYDKSIKITHIDLLK